MGIVHFCVQKQLNYDANDFVKSRDILYQVLSNRGIGMATSVMRSKMEAYVV